MMAKAAESHTEFVETAAFPFLLGAALADAALAQREAAIAASDAEVSRLTLEVEKLRLRHAAEGIDLWLSTLGDCPFRDALKVWNEHRLQIAAAGLAANDVLGLRRLNDTCERDFDAIVARYFE